MDPNKLQGFNKLKQLETTKTGSVPVNVWSNGDKAQQRNSLIVSLRGCAPQANQTLFSVL